MQTINHVYRHVNALNHIEQMSSVIYLVDSHYAFTTKLSFKFNIISENVFNTFRTIFYFLFITL